MQKENRTQKNFFSVEELLFNSPKVDLRKKKKKNRRASSKEGIEGGRIGP